MSTYPAPAQRSALSTQHAVELSVVIPAYNEAAVIGDTVARVAAYLEASGNHELIVVDDGSRDATASTVQAFAAEHPCVRLVSNPGNRGKGYAIRNGVLHARGEYVLYTDADLVYPIEGAAPFLAALRAGADVAIGSRSHAGTLFALHPRHFSYIYQRYLVGRAYIAVVNWLLHLGVTDTQCGFKAFRGAVARDVFARLCLDDFAFDVEALYVARARGYRLVELPVYFLYLGEQSSVELVQDSFRMLRDLWRIRAHGRAGLYTRDEVPAEALEALPPLEVEP
ncbi:MAG TPA: dolichyl-phosphate beta-glucosyltransferase [Chloroflexota bacterium]|nr:dolichyl-phosphate beta-glucosyltransferase [Chloroflexota bacterium]